MSNDKIVLPRGKASYGYTRENDGKWVNGGPVTSKDDKVPALLPSGCYTIAKEVVEKYYVNLHLMNCKFKVGDEVEKVGGDYTFAGKVVSIFSKRSGQIRLVVEDDRGLLFIFNESQLNGTS